MEKGRHERGSFYSVVKYHHICFFLADISVHFYHGCQILFIPLLLYISWCIEGWPDLPYQSLFYNLEKHVRPQCGLCFLKSQRFETGLWCDIVIVIWSHLSLSCGLLWEFILACKIPKKRKKKKKKDKKGVNCFKQQLIMRLKLKRVTQALPNLWITPYNPVPWELLWQQTHFHFYGWLLTFNWQLCLIRK